MKSNSKYEIIRMYQAAGMRMSVLERNLTLAEAQAHCQDPETSSSTCTAKSGQARTERFGAWFDGYQEQK